MSTCQTKTRILILIFIRLIIYFVSDKKVTTQQQIDNSIQNHQSEIIPTPNNSQESNQNREIKKSESISQEIPSQI